MKSNVKERLRKCIYNLKAESYAVDHYGADLTDFLDCSNGINPFGVSDTVKKCLIQIPAELVNQYPQSSLELKNAIIDHWSQILPLEDSQIELGDGSIELIYKINKLFIADSDSVLGYYPQFPDYIKDVQTCGGCYEGHHLDPESNYGFSADCFLELMSERHSLFYLDNPNNPTGQVIELKDIERLVAKARDLNSPIVIDEAYGDFIGKDRSAVALLGTYDNLIVIRTFSKGLGLAGLRAGYIVTSEEIAGYFKRISNPYELNGVSRMLCMAALKDEDFMKDSIAKVKINKERLMGAVKVLNILETDPCVPILTVMHPDEEVDLEILLMDQKIMSVSGRSFIGLGENAVRLMINADVDRLIQGLVNVEKSI